MHLQGAEAGVYEPVRKCFPRAPASRTQGTCLPDPEQDQHPHGLGSPPAALEAVRSQNRVSQRSLGFDLAPKSVLAFSKPGTPLGFEMHAH